MRSMLLYFEIERDSQSIVGSLISDIHCIWQLFHKSKVMIHNIIYGLNSPIITKEEEDIKFSQHDHRRSWHGPPPFFLTFCLQIYFQLNFFISLYYFISFFLF